MDIDSRRRGGNVLWSSSREHAFEAEHAGGLCSIPEDLVLPFAYIDDTLAGHLAFAAEIPQVTVAGY
jgi:hypothetical protein